MKNQRKIRILVVDDEEIVRESMASWLRGEGYQILSAASGKEALSLSSKHAFDIALIDLKMPEMDGIQVLQHLATLSPETLPLIVTAHATIDSAVDAMKKGAYDYIVKPFNPEEISLVIERISNHLQLIAENKLLKSKIARTSAFTNIVTCSEKMYRLFEVARQVAKSKATVLILGESGTGKELLARSIHDDSPRKDRPFIPVACAALSDTLLEDDIFGHEKGAFTDAKELRKGKFELAHGGTLFLDEIGDISAKLQLDLLRVLQEKEFTRLGGSSLINVDVRVISATNREIEKMVLEEKFRDDLFYRLNVITLNVPPLRERKEDIYPLAKYFIQKYAKESNKDPDISISGITLKILLEYSYPGNVRELEGTIEHAVILCKDNLIRPEDLPDRIRGLPKNIEEAKERYSLSTMEKNHIAQVLEENDFNITKCSQILGVDRKTLYLKMKKYEINRKKN